MSFYPRVKDEVLTKIEHSLVKYLLTEGDCSRCEECPICIKRALHLTGGDFEALKKQFLVEIVERCTPEIEFFEVHHGGNSEYYTTLSSAEERVRDLQESGLNIDATIIGRSFME